MQVLYLVCGKEATARHLPGEGKGFLAGTIRGAVSPLEFVCTGQELRPGEQQLHQNRAGGGQRNLLEENQFGSGLERVMLARSGGTICLFMLG